MSNMRDLLDKINELNEDDGSIQLHDSFDIELNEGFVIETGVIGFTDDGIIVEADEQMLEFLDINDIILESEDYDSYESMTDHELIKMMRQGGRGKSCVIDGEGQLANRDEVIEILKQDEELNEAEYQGRKVPLGKPMAGDVKKSKVYVKKPNGKVVKVNFGDKNMKIKKSNPNRRKSFRARHRCENPGPRWKARYWSCRAW